MSTILIERDHQLGLEQARQTITKWVAQAEQKFDLQCQVQQGEASDCVSFSRSGLNGTLEVSGQHFRLEAKLGFLLSAFKDRIEGEIQKNLDKLIATHQAKA